MLHGTNVKNTNEHTDMCSLKMTFSWNMTSINHISHRLFKKELLHKLGSYRPIGISLIRFLWLHQSSLHSSLLYYTRAVRKFPILSMYFSAVQLSQIYINSKSDRFKFFIRTA